MGCVKNSPMRYGTTVHNHNLCRSCKRSLAKAFGMNKLPDGWDVRIEVNQKYPEVYRVALLDEDGKTKGFYSIDGTGKSANVTAWEQSTETGRILKEYIDPHSPEGQAEYQKNLKAFHDTYPVNVEDLIIHDGMQKDPRDFMKGMTYSRNGQSENDTIFTSHNQGHVMTVAANMSVMAQRGTNKSAESQFRELGWSEERRADFVPINNNMKIRCVVEAALHHDDGMFETGVTQVQYKHDSGNPENPFARDANGRLIRIEESMGIKVDGEHSFKDTRKNHAASGMTSMLENMDEYIAKGFTQDDVIRMSAIVFAHSKSNCGLKGEGELNSRQALSDMVQRMGDTIESYNQAFPDHPIKYTEADLRRAIMPNDETLGSVASAIQMVRAADANRIAEYGDQTQSGNRLVYNRDNIPLVSDYSEKEITAMMNSNIGVENKWGMEMPHPSSGIKGYTKRLAEYEDRYEQAAACYEALHTVTDSGDFGIQLYDALRDTVKPQPLANPAKDQGSLVGNIGGQNLLFDRQVYDVRDDGTQVYHETVQSEHGTYMTIREIKDRIAEFQSGKSIPTEVHVHLPQNCSDSTRRAYERAFTEPRMAGYLKQSLGTKVILE